MFTWVVEHGMVPLLVPGCRRMFTSVGEHGMVPLLVPGVFPPVCGIYINKHRYENEAIPKRKTENNIGVPAAPQ